MSDAYLQGGESAILVDTIERSIELDAGQLQYTQYILRNDGATRIHYGWATGVTTHLATLTTTTVTVSKSPSIPPGGSIVVQRLDADEILYAKCASSSSELVVTAVRPKRQI